MARSRNIKPGFFTNELLGTYDPMISLLFAGLWCLADKDGILEDRPLRIKAELFPYREGLDVNGYLTVLERDAFLTRYEVAGVKYIQINNFAKHQSPHHTEKPKGYPKQQAEQGAPSKPVLTPLSNGESKVPERSDSLIPDSLIPDSLQNPAPEKPARFDPLKISLPGCINPETWGEWIAYRRERKLTTRQATMQAQVDELVTWAKSGHDPTSVIKTSIAKGWQGLFEPKQGNQNANYSSFVAELTGRNRREDASVIDGQAERVD